MRPTVLQYARALEELVHDAHHDSVAAVVKKLQAYLKRIGEQERLPAIVRQLEKLEAEKSGRVDVTIVTGRELHGKAKDDVTEKAKRLFPGKKIESKFEVKSDVIGGAAYRTDEVLFDATVSKELQALKRAIVQV